MLEYDKEKEKFLKVFLEKVLKGDVEVSEY